MNYSTRSIQRYTLLLWAVIAIASRLLPHPPNMTANAALALSAGWLFQKRDAISLSLVSMLLSDILLACLQHHPVFGLWSLFTYSGVLIITLLGFKLPTAIQSRHGLLLIASSVGFWAWINLSAWISLPYSLDLPGFLACYSAALPFLKSQLIGDGLWFGVILSTALLIKRQCMATSH